MRSNKDKGIKKTLGKNHACYVLITCDEPTADGNMQVEMSYQGDANIASYLLQGAQNIIDEDCCCNPDHSHQNKIQPLDRTSLG